jgi:hypothetical protein
MPTQQWQHLDLDGKEMQSGGRYTYFAAAGVVSWGTKNGFVFKKDEGGRVFPLPFDYRGNQVVVYKVRRALDE